MCPTSIGRRTGSAISTAFALVWLVVACDSSDSSESREGGTCATQQAIIGGDLADGADWRAVGTVGTVAPESGPVYHAVCSASLVAPNLVLTAKHCVAGLDRAKSFGARVLFAVGSDAERPERLLALVDAERALPESGGFLGKGSDIAIYQLERDVLDVSPLVISPLPISQMEIGATFLALGYGATTNAESRGAPFSGHRRAGRQTLRALEGNVLEMVFGSRMACASDEPLVQPAREDNCVPQTTDATNCAAYETAVLLSNYEVWAGGSIGDAQTCHGDSGGPLVRNSGGRMEVVAVASWGWRSRESGCSYGTVFATVPSQIRDAVARGMR